MPVTLPAGPLPAGYQPEGYRIGDDREDDGHRLRRVGRGAGGRTAERQDSGYTTPGEVGGERGQTIELALSVAGFEGDISALDVAEASELLLEHLDGRAGTAVDKKADALRVGAGGCAGYERDCDGCYGRGGEVASHGDGPPRAAPMLSSRLQTPQVGGNP